MAIGIISTLLLPIPAMSMYRNKNAMNFGMEPDSGLKPDFISAAEKAANLFRDEISRRIATYQLLSLDFDEWQPEPDVARLSGLTHRIVLDHREHPTTHNGYFKLKLVIFRNNIKENLDLTTIIGTDFVVRSSLQGYHLLLRRTTPRYSAGENRQNQSSWSVITNSRWRENFYDNNSPIHKYIWNAYRDFCKNENLVTDAIDRFANFIYRVLITSFSICILDIKPWFV